MEIEVRVGVYATPDEDSYSVNFTIDALNHAYPGCTGMYLGEVGHMLAFYGRKANPKAGLIHDEAVVASKAIIDIPTWMGYFARWRTKCVSVSEASEIVAGCKRLEKENWGQARWELQQQFSAIQVDLALSATARPFQPQAAPQSSNEDGGQAVYPARSGWSGSHPTLGLVPSSPVRRTSFSHPLSSEMREHLVMPLIMTGLLVRGMEVEGVKRAEVAATPMIRAPPEGDKRRRMDFLVKSRFLNLVVRRDILMMWLTPLGSGLAVSLTTAITMKIPTSCLW